MPHGVRLSEGFGLTRPKRDMGESAMHRGARESNEESARMGHARALVDGFGRVLAALNTLPTEDDVRRIVREELAMRAALPDDLERICADLPAHAAMAVRRAWAAR